MRLNPGGVTCNTHESHDVIGSLLRTASGQSPGALFVPVYKLLKKLGAWEASVCLRMPQVINILLVHEIEILQELQGCILSGVMSLFLLI